MMKAVWGSVLTAAAIVLLSPASVAAQATDTATVTVSAAINPKAKLTLSRLTASFPNLDPDTAPTLTSTTPITVTVKARTGGTLTLTVVASDDLKSGTDAIPIANLTWDATVDLQAGTMDKTTAQTLLSSTTSGTMSGVQTYKLLNEWTYKTGNYSATITYTLTAP